MSIKRLLLLLSLIVCCHCAITFAQTVVDEENILCVHPTRGRLRTALSVCPSGYIPMTTESVGALGASSGGIVGKAGSKGSKGVDGADGDKGPRGDKGFGILDVVPSLTTITGTVGGGFSMQSTLPGDIAAWSKLVPLNVRIPFPLEDSGVSIASTPATRSCAPINGQPCVDPIELQSSALCTGSYTSPTAPPGKVCVYPSSLQNVILLKANALGKNGFEVEWRSVPSIGNRTDMQASWAYTAP